MAKGGSGAPLSREGRGSPSDSLRQCSCGRVRIARAARVPAALKERCACCVCLCRRMAFPRMQLTTAPSSSTRRSAGRWDVSGLGREQGGDVEGRSSCLGCAWAARVCDVGLQSCPGLGAFGLWVRGCALEGILSIYSHCWVGCVSWSPEVEG